MRVLTAGADWHEGRDQSFRSEHDSGIFHISSAEEKIGGVFEHCNEAVGTSLEYAVLRVVAADETSARSGLHVASGAADRFRILMDVKRFAERESSTRSEKLCFDLASTHAELEKEGVIAPALDHELLRIRVESNVMRDPELRAAMGHRRHTPTRLRF